MAKPGYGKRSAPDQLPYRHGDFDHLPPREAYIASLLDRLDENAAMDAKTIAKAQPLYGQQAVRSALNELGRAGHLRRVRRRIAPSEGPATGTRWVFHTYWSRTARDTEWWARLLDGDVTPQPPAEAPHTADPEAAPSTATLEAEPSPIPEKPRPSPAYTALAHLGLRDPRLALSSADCAALEHMAADWLMRGVTPDHLTQVLISGLPEQVHSPRAFVGRRLSDKMPPERPASAPRASRALMECTDCGVPGRPEALPGGLCRACRGGVGSTPRTSLPVQPAVLRARAAQVRASIHASHSP